METYNGIVCTGAALAHQGYDADEAPGWVTEIVTYNANDSAVIVGVDLDAPGFYSRPWCDGCGAYHLGQDMFPALLEAVA